MLDPLEFRLTVRCKDKRKLRGLLDFLFHKEFLNFE